MSFKGQRGIFAATMLTKVMSGDMTSGIKLAVGKPGYNPHTNTLYLPGIPAGDIEEKTLDKLLAYLGHEAAERGLSTWDPRDPRWVKKSGLRTLVNGINDARIDLIQGDRYPGCGMKIRAVRLGHLKKMVKAYRENPDTYKCSVRAIACLAVYVAEELVVVDQLYKLFPNWSKFLKRVDHALRTLDLSTEQRCIEQAIEMYELLQKPAPDEPAPKPERGEQSKQATPEKGGQAPREPQQGQGDPMDEGPDADDEDLDSEGSAGADNDNDDEELDDDSEGEAQGQSRRGGAGDKEDAAEPEGGEEAEGDDSDSAGGDAAGSGRAGPADGDGKEEAADAAGEDGAEAPAEGGRDAVDTVRVPRDREPGTVDAPEPTTKGTSIPGPRDHTRGGVKDDGEKLPDEGAPIVDMQDDLLNQIVGEIFNGQDGENKGRSPHSRAYYDNRPTSYTYDPSWDEIRTAKPANDVMDRKRYARPAQVLETKLKQVMTAPAVRHVRNRDKGSVDERAISRLVIGDTNVFERRMRVEAESVACAVSWDESDSMAGNYLNGKQGQPPISLVRDLAYTWNEALGKLNIPTGMYGWGSHEGSRGGNPNVYREGSVRHLTYKDFNERWNDDRVLKRLHNISTVFSTPTGEGLLYAAEKLGKRPESRRILFFLTDGQPGMRINGDRQVHLDFIKLLVGRMLRAGIELVGVGINAKLDHLFPHWLNITDVSDLQAKAATELVELLRTTRSEKRTV